MFFIKKLTVFASICFVGAFAFAQETNETAEQAKTVNLTLMEAVDYAMENSRDLKSADIDLAIKERAGKNAWNVLLPDVSASFTMNRSNESLYDNYASSAWQAVGMTGNLMSLSDIKNSGFDYKDNESAHWTGVVGLSIGWNFSLAYIEQIKAAKVNYEAGKISYEKSLLETEVNVKKLFYGLLLQQENLNLQKTILENSRQRMVQAETNFKNGLVPELSMLQTQVTYENKSPEVAQLEREFRQQIDTFAFILGMPVGTDIVLVGSIEPFYVDLNYDTLLERYGSNSLDIQEIDKAIDALERNLKALNLSTYVPSLSVNYAWQPTLPGYALDGSNWSDFPSSGSWTDNGAFSITLAWDLTNLLPFSSNRQNAKDVQANIEKQKLNREMLIENQKIEVRTAIDTLIQAREQILSMNRSISLAQRSYDMTVRAYRNGTTELLDVRDAEDQLAQAKLGLANEKFNYISALLDLEKTLNTKLTGGEK